MRSDFISGNAFANIPPGLSNQHEDALVRRRIRLSLQIVKEDWRRCVEQLDILWFCK